MSVKKKKKKKSPLTQLPDDKLKLVEELLSNSHNLTCEIIKEKINDPSIASAFIEKTPAKEEYIPTVLIIKELFGAEKQVIKALKRLIFRMKQKGIKTEELEFKDTESPILKIDTQIPEPISYLGPVGYAGHRMLFVSIPFPMGLYETGTGFINDSGISAFYHGRQRKKEMKRQEKIFFEHNKDYIDTTLEHIATLLERAYKMEEKSHDENYLSYAEFRPYLLEKAKPCDQHPIYSLIPEQELKDQPLTSFMISSLLEHELMKSWIISPEDMEPVLKEIEEAENSPLHLTPEQINERVYSIKRDAIKKIFSLEKLNNLKHNLLEMAYFFYKKDEISLAKTALLCAESLKQDDKLSIMPSFLEALMDRMISLYEDFKEEAMEEEDSSSDLILTPDDLFSS